MGGAIAEHGFKLPLHVSYATSLGDCDLVVTINFEHLPSGFDILGTVGTGPKLEKSHTYQAVLPLLGLLGLG